MAVMTNRRDALLDAAIDVVGQSGIHGLTHRAVDVAAGLPGGSASNHFRTRDALLNAVAERFAARERANWEQIAVEIYPATPEELALALARFAQDAAGPDRTLALARYAILVEAANCPPLQDQLTVTGKRVNAWFTNWVRIAGSADPGRDAPIIMNHWTGIVLHQLASPDPAFSPLPQISALVTALIRPQPRRYQHDRPPGQPHPPGPQPGLAGDRRSAPGPGRPAR